MLRVMVMQWYVVNSLGMNALGGRSPGGIRSIYGSVSESFREIDVRIFSAIAENIKA